MNINMYYCSWQNGRGKPYSWFPGTWTEFQVMIMSLDHNRTNKNQHCQRRIEPTILCIMLWRMPNHGKSPRVGDTFLKQKVHLLVDISRTDDDRTML